MESQNVIPLQQFKSFEMDVILTTVSISGFKLGCCLLLSYLSFLAGNSQSFNCPWQDGIPSLCHADTLSDVFGGLQGSQGMQPHCVETRDVHHHSSRCSSRLGRK
jgi:hypothetical protein